MGKINIGLCQFPVSGDIEANSRRIRAFINEAAEKGTDIVHFSECALGGYASADIADFEDYDWQMLQLHTEKILRLAAEKRVWVVLGTNYKAPETGFIHNSLLLINNTGEIADRYDKRFCTPSDIVFYQPGEHFVIFELGGICCSLLICYDLRFPELYRELKKMGVECIFQSFYNARQSQPSVHTDIMQQTMQCRAATNYFWVSMTNSCAPISPYSSCIIRPDGKITAKLEDETPGLIVETIDTSQEFYDASAPYRNLAISGILSNISMYSPKDN